MHRIRISINSPLGVMEANDKYDHKYTYYIFESFEKKEISQGGLNIYKTEILKMLNYKKA